MRTGKNGENGEKVVCTRGDVCAQGERVNGERSVYTRFKFELRRARLTTNRQNVNLLRPHLYNNQLYIIGS
jgi:hypothetical protein